MQTHRLHFLLFQRAKLQKMKANHNCYLRGMRDEQLFQRAKLQKMKANHNSHSFKASCPSTVSKSKITKNES